ncbi:MAG: hypothetical protein M3081_01865, partial [Gemmatimonadota bacterium]|nr:hypothetical protein [Gemmatimonadota bacterium]
TPNSAANRVARTATTGPAASVIEPAPRISTPDISRINLDRVTKGIDDSVRSRVDSAGRTVRLQGPTFQTKRPNVIGRP